MTDCPICWGTHGCDLEKHHDGEHQCLEYTYDEDTDEAIAIGVCNTPLDQPWATPFCFMCRRQENKSKACKECEGINL